MTYLLDTNACIALLNRSSLSLADRFRSTPPSQVRLCSIVKMELLAGARKSRSPAANLQKLRRFFAPIKSLPFDDGCAEQAGLVRAELERLGTPVGPMDTLIAGTALHYEVTLITRNLQEFIRVAGLSLENWET